MGRWNLLMPTLQISGSDLNEVIGYYYSGHNNDGSLNSLRPRQGGRHLPDDIFKCIFLNENELILIKISLKFVPNGPINNIPALVQIMAWPWWGDKPLFEPMMFSLLTQKYVTLPQLVNSLAPGRCNSHFKSIIFKLIIIQNSSLDICCEFAFGSMLQNFPSGNKPSPEPMLTQIYVANSPYGLTRPQSCDKKLT